MHVVCQFVVFYLFLLFFGHFFLSNTIVHIFYMKTCLSFLLLSYKHELTYSPKLPHVWTNSFWGTKTQVLELVPTKRSERERIEKKKKRFKSKKWEIKIGLCIKHHIKINMKANYLNASCILFYISEIKIYKTKVLFLLFLPNKHQESIWITLVTLQYK